MIKKIVYICLGVVDVLFLYLFIGYFVKGGQQPKIVGETTTFSWGFYVVGITYLCLFIILSIAIIVSLLILKRKKSNQ